MILDKIKAYGFQALCLVLFIGLGVQTLRLASTELELANTRAEFAQVAKEQAINLAAATAKARSAEAKLQADASQIRSQTNDQVRSLSVQRDALLVRLRDAQKRLSTVPGAGAVARPGPVAAGGDGQTVPARIGEEDVREAERADVLRLHLAACYAQYGRAQEALKGAQ